MNRFAIANSVLKIGLSDSDKQKKMHSRLDEAFDARRRGDSPPSTEPVPDSYDLFQR